MKAIMNDEVMERLIDTLMELQTKESTNLPLLKKQLAETEKGINNMLNAIQTGIFTPSTKQRLDELEKTKSQLEVSILQEEMHKLILTFNYKDGSKTITLAEVEGSDLSVLGAPSRSKRYKACSDFFQKSEESLRAKVFEKTILENIGAIETQNQVSMINSEIIQKAETILCPHFYYSFYFADGRYSIFCLTADAVPAIL